jgi:hypothetical protein
MKSETSLIREDHFVDPADMIAEHNHNRDETVRYYIDALVDTLSCPLIKSWAFEKQ